MKEQIASEWPAADIDQLTTLWDQGKSSGEIGKEMGRTRNAVIGKIHRLKLQGHPFKRASQTQAQVLANASARRAQIARRKPRNPERQLREDLRTLAKVRLVITGNGSVMEVPAAEPSPYADVPDDVWAPLPGIEPLPLMRLSSISCRWPVDVPDAQEQHFCSALKIGGPYCLHHAKAGRSNVKPSTKQDLERLAKRCAA